MISRSDLRRDVAAALMGAALMVLAAPPVGWWPAGVVAWAPLALITATRPPWHAAMMGWAQGTVAQAAALASVAQALHTAAGASTWVAVFGVGVLSLYEGARFGVLAFAASRAHVNGWPFLLAFPLALVLSERLYPTFFPWTTALLLHGAPVLLQTADLAGTMGISLWTGLVCASLANAWVQRDRWRSRLSVDLAVPACTCAVVWLYGVASEHAAQERLTAAPSATIGLVQGNLDKVTGQVTDPAPQYREASLDLVRGAGVDLLVWPETAMHQPIRAEDLERFLANRIFSDAAKAQPARLRVPILAGFVIDRPDSDQVAQAPGSGRRRFNSAVLATPDGHVSGSYDKRSLVMFGEYIPGEHALPWLRRILPRAGSFSPGKSHEAPLSLGDERILPLICLEDTLEDRVRTDVADLDPDLIINLTSDAWFGASRVPALHLALATMRAIEHRRFLVHATNTGVTAVVDPTGRVVDELPRQQQTTGRATIRWLRGATFYGRCGTAIEWALVALGLIVVVVPRQALLKPKGRTKGMAMPGR